MHVKATCSIYLALCHEFDQLENSVSQSGVENWVNEKSD
jgi:hypothetical protein